MAGATVGVAQGAPEPRYGPPSVMLALTAGQTGCPPAGGRTSPFSRRGPRSQVPGVLALSTAISVGTNPRPLWNDTNTAEQA